MNFNFELHPCLCILAGRPAMGKTTFALEAALYTAKKSGKAVAFFSFAESEQWLRKLMLASESEISRDRIEHGNLSPEEMSRLMAAESRIRSLNIIIEDSPKDEQAIMDQCRKISNLGLVIVDYLQLLTHRSFRVNTIVQHSSVILEKLKCLSKELDIPILCLSQLSREIESRLNKRPRWQDLRCLGAFVQNADVVLGLYRAAYYKDKTAEPNMAECIVIKNRYGDAGVIKLHFKGDIPSFSFAHLDCDKKEFSRYD